MTQKNLLRRIYWIAAILSAFVFAIFISVVFLNPTSVGSPHFIQNINLWAVIWAFTFVIVLILSFVLARDLIKLFFEHQAKQPGSGIKGKLVTTFIIFSMFPALIMSVLAFGLINRNLRLWFASPSEQLLYSTEEIATRFYEQNRELSLLLVRELAELLERAPGIPQEVDLELEAGRSKLGFQAVALFDSEAGEIGRSGEWLGEPELRNRAFLEARQLGESYLHQRLNEMERADADLVVAGILVGGGNYCLVAQTILPQSVAFHAIEAEEARRKYEALKNSISQAELNYFSMLALTTLAVIFGFVWLGTYIAKKITVPFEALAKGAQELAQGNLDHRVDVKAVDELGVLLDSFNRMAGEIKLSRQKLEQANQELRSTNAELNERRRYTETVLQNITTGVVSVDEDDVIRTVNRAAGEMLQRTADSLLGQTVNQVVGKGLQAEFQKLKRRAALYGTYRQNVTFKQGDRVRYVAATATVNPMPARDGKEFLIVLDDLTELIKAEKFAAWQEVARRLAHEIKNPLTPIQLSAERIVKRFENISNHADSEYAEFRRVLEDGVRIIRAEAEMLKTLVDEFSQFARLPMSRPAETDLHALIRHALSLYDGGLQTVRVKESFDPEIGFLNLDAEQMRRVLFNLIENALDALSECDDREIEIATRLDKDRNSIRIEFKDNGKGIAPTDYENLFLPYFSTKKKGTGLGLAIVRQIVTEHSGFIRAEPNLPSGMKFLIDLPATLETGRE